MRYLSFCFIVSVLFSPLLAAAQLSSLPISVISFHSANEADAKLENEIKDFLSHQLEGTISVQTVIHGNVLLVDAHEIDNSTLVVVSISSMANLPKDVVEAGVDSELFYVAMKDTTDTSAMTAEGKDMRRYMTREWLSQFHNVTAQELFVVDRSELYSRLDDFVIQFAAPRH